MGGGDEGGEVGCFGGVGGLFFGEDLLEAVRVIGDEAVDTEIDEGANFFGVVGGPRDDAEAGLVKLGYVDGGGGAEERSVNWGESGAEGVVGLGVGVGGGEEEEVWVLVIHRWHGGEEGRGEGGGTDGG